MHNIRYSPLFFRQTIISVSNILYCYLSSATAIFTASPEPRLFRPSAFTYSVHLSIPYHTILFSSVSDVCHLIRSFFFFHYVVCDVLEPVHSAASISKAYDLRKAMLSLNDQNNRIIQWHFFDYGVIYSSFSAVSNKFGPAYPT